MAKAAKNRTVMTHPETKREMKVDSAIYEPVKEAILQSLKGSSGKSFTVHRWRTQTDMMPTICPKALAVTGLI